MGRRRIVVLLGALLALAAPAGAEAAGEVKAGVAVVDATYHIGPSAGQYASDRLDGEYGDVDPNMQTVKNKASYGVQSRNAAKAIVVKGTDGKLVALVRNDHYISQDALWRRTAQLLAADTGGAIGEQNLIMAVTHNHSSPYYSSLDWGVWTFQDVFDYRFYDYWARRQALAVETALKHMHDAKVSATASHFDKTMRNSMGPAIADDGTPAGFPKSYTDNDLSVIRFDNIDDPSHPKPLATIVNFGEHGESLEGYDLISGEWTQTLERLMDRSTGGTTIFTQNATGTTELERDSYHSIHERLLFDHAQYQQMEYGAHLMAENALRDWNDIGRQKPNTRDHAPDGMLDYADRFVPWMRAFPVKIEDRWFGGPVSHPYPGVSSCKTDPAFAGDPRYPIVGLPDCENTDDTVGEVYDNSPVDLPVQIRPMADVLNPLKQSLPVQWPAVTNDDLEALGVPVPENLSFPSHGALEDTYGVHLQAVRFGDILLTMCSCEQWADQSKNIKTRTDTKPGNEFLGYDWSQKCEHNGPDGTWICADPRNESAKLPPLTDALIEHMQAQVLNDAAGWDDPTCTDQGCGVRAESEDPNHIRGNYTHDDTTVRGGANQTDAFAQQFGYPMTITVGFTNDYNGYIATYREYSDRDHYRKALTGWGPHSSDYMATRLVQMGQALKGNGAAQKALDAQTDPAAGSPWAPIAAKEVADQAAEEARVRAVGEAASAGVTAYDATLPDDGGSDKPAVQPKDIERFDAATFGWDGGSNYVDNPQVTVERKLHGDWVPFADQTGEIPLTLKYPGTASLTKPWTLATAQVQYHKGGQVWRYTASFEAFGSQFWLVDPQGKRYDATPEGDYRFVVHGVWRKGGANTPYTRVSDAFEVRTWSGITVEDAAIADDGHATFRAGPTHTFQTDRVRKTETPGLGKLPITVGPVDFPDTVRDQKATGARFLNSLRGYTATSPTDTESYCLDCRFRPWADATSDIEATITIDRQGVPHPIVERHLRPDASGAFRSDSALQPGDRAVIVISDGWDDYSAAPATLFVPGDVGGGTGPGRGRGRGR